MACWISALKRGELRVLDVRARSWRCSHNSLPEQEVMMMNIGGVKFAPPGDAQIKTEEDNG